LFIDLKPWHLVLLKEDVARLLLLRGVENAVDVLRHGSLRNFYHGTDTWQRLLTDLEAAQEVLLFPCRGKGFANRRVRLLGLLKLMQTLSVPSRLKSALFVYNLDLLVDYFPGKTVDHYMHPVMLFHFRDKIRQG